MRSIPGATGFTKIGMISACGTSIPTLMPMTRTRVAARTLVRGHRRYHYQLLISSVLVGPLAACSLFTKEGVVSPPPCHEKTIWSCSESSLALRLRAITGASPHIRSRLKPAPSMPYSAHCSTSKRSLVQSQYAPPERHKSRSGTYLAASLTLASPSNLHVAEHVADFRRRKVREPAERLRDRCSEWAATVLEVNATSPSS